jgi:hypothetical protein
MKKITDKTIDIIQWVFVILLLTLLIIQGINYNTIKKQLVVSEEYNKENTYIRIYESQKLNELKKQNKELYDSISKLKDVESGMIIKFHEHYNTDTIKVEKFIVKKDTVLCYAENKDSIIEKVDSIYHYTQDNDTVKLDIDVKANNMKWVKADFTIYDKFTITNREKDGVNQTTITHSDNATIDNTAMWHRKNTKKWYENFVVSPQVGLGYGTIHKNLDMYVGVGLGYQFKK